MSEPVPVCVHCRAPLRESMRAYPDPALTKFWWEPQCDCVSTDTGRFMARHGLTRIEADKLMEAIEDGWLDESSITPGFLRGFRDVLKT